MKPMLDPKRDLNSVVCQPFSSFYKNKLLRIRHVDHAGFFTLRNSFSANFFSRFGRC